jgi:hypothetical protein
LGYLPRPFVDLARPVRAVGDDLHTRLCALGSGQPSRQSLYRGAAVLVATVFMRLSEGNTLNRLAAAAAPIWIFIMLLMIGADYFTR